MQGRILTETLWEVGAGGTFGDHRDGGDESGQKKATSGRRKEEGESP